MKHSYLQFKRSAFLFLIASALFGKVSAQSDSLRSARTDGTQSVNGTVTYDGTGAGTGGAEGTYIGYQAGAVTTGEHNTFVGGNSGYNNTSGKWNTFVGQRSGYSHTTGNRNIFIGGLSGYYTTSGINNVFTGFYSGIKNTTGTQNAFYGNYAGNESTTGNNNTYLGLAAGFKNVDGSGNIFVGYKSGYNELGSNKLYIANSDTISPLIKGDFALKQLVLNGKVGIGTSAFPSSVGGANVNNYQLFVKGGILSDEVRVRTGWADYVFQKDYKLTSLEEVQTFITDHGHLPNVPSATQIEESGLNLGEVSRIQMEKIEELTLYVIKQDELLKSQQREINELRTMVAGLLVKNK